MKKRRYVEKKKKNSPFLFISFGAVLLLLVAISTLWQNSDDIKSDENSSEQMEDEKSQVNAKEDPQQEPEEEVEKGEVEPELEPEPKKEEVEPTPPVVEKSPDPVKEETQKSNELNLNVNGGYIEGQPEPSKPTYISGVLIANKKYPLPKSYDPGENKTARAAFEKMAKDAGVAGFELVAFSTYRSYEYQKTLYDRYANRDGIANADRYSARPGYSEHQTGLAFDIGEKGKEDLWLTEAFGETQAGKWLVENAHKYGFILRYPKGKESITGYMYESWHFRYLGVELATKVKNSNLTLEEYLNI